MAEHMEHSHKLITLKYKIFSFFKISLKTVMKLYNFID